MSTLSDIWSDREIEHAWTLEVGTWEEEHERSPEVDLVRAETQRLVTATPRRSFVITANGPVIPLPYADMTEEEIVDYLNELEEGGG